MLKSNKRFYFIIFFIALFVQCYNCCFAQYETYQAKTVLTQEEKNNLGFKESTDENFFEEKEVPFESDNDLASIISRKISKRKNKKDRIENDISPEESNVETNYENTTNEKTSYDYTITEKIDNKNKFQINADKVSYDEENGNLYANGNVEIIAKEQGVTLKANDAAMDKTNQTLTLTGNVRVIKGGVEMKGENLNIDLNDQNILMENPITDAFSFKIIAQEGYLISNNLQLLNGTIQSEKEQEITLQSNGFTQFKDATYENIRRGALKIESGSTVARKHRYTINAKEIVLTSFKDHNTILLKDSDIFFNNHKIINKTDIEIISDKDKQVFETNSPEAGSLRNFGTYIGYGFAFKLPHGQVGKLVPAFVIGKGKPGVGIIGRYVTPNGKLEAGISSSTENLVVNGIYHLSPSLNLRYGRNTYLYESFLGTRKPGYGAQLEWQKSYNIPDLKSVFNHGVYAGFYSDYKSKNIENAYSTTRFRYMAQIHRKILQYENKERDLKITFSMQSQAAATLYGSGKTFGLVRVGPFLTTKLKHWESGIGYLLSGVHGDSPFKFDKYTYGHSSIMLNEKFNFTKKFALGYKAFLCPNKDNPNHDFLTESKFYAVVGPEDLKIALSYDFVRERAFINMMFILGTENAKINFEKLITKNMDNKEQKKDFYKKYNKTNIDI